MRSLRAQLTALYLAFFTLLFAVFSVFLYGELARSLRASWWQTFVKVRLIWALPQVFVGLKVATPLAIIGAVIGEVVNPDHGLGSVIALSGQSSDTPLAFAALVLLAVLGVVLFYLVAGLERLLVPWARSLSS